MRHRTLVASLQALLPLLAAACVSGGGSETGDSERSGVVVRVSADHPDWLPTDETPLFDLHIRAPGDSVDVDVVSLPLDEPTWVDVADGMWTFQAWYEWEDPNLVSDDPNGYISTGCEGEAAVEVPAPGGAVAELPTECTTQFGS